MAKKKKSSKLDLIYLIGVALVVVGFFMPMFSGLGMKANGFDFISFKNFSATTIAALLIIIGAAAGVVFCFVGHKDADMIKLLALLASIAGGVILVITYNKNAFTQFVGNSFLKNATYGFYLVIAGWIVGIVGRFKK